MNQVETVFLDLVRCGIKGETPTDPVLSAEGWDALLRLAESHRLLPLVLDLSLKLPSCSAALSATGKDGAQKPSGSAWKQNAFAQVSRQIIQENEFLNLILALQAKGLDPVIMKGPACRALYPNGWLRPSVDDDFTVPAEQMAAFHTALLEYGMKPDEPEVDPEQAWEISYHAPNSTLYVEMHKCLFDPNSPVFSTFNTAFADHFQHTSKLQVQDVAVQVMGPTDHLLFLILHAFKHFLHSGFGVRIVADICLFSQKYAEEIDFSRIFQFCQANSCFKFTAAVYRIGSLFLDLQIPEPFQAVEVDEAPLLADMMNAGHLGVQMERLHSANIILGAVSESRMGKRKSNFLKRAVFLPPDRLAGDFPFLKKHPWLVPVAWTRRVWTYLRTTKKYGKQSLTAPLRVGQERLELLKTYDIIQS